MRIAGFMPYAVAGLSVFLYTSVFAEQPKPVNVVNTPLPVEVENQVPVSGQIEVTNSSLNVNVKNLPDVYVTNSESDPIPVFVVNDVFSLREPVQKFVNSNNSSKFEIISVPYDRLLVIESVTARANYSAGGFLEEAYIIGSFSGAVQVHFLQLLKTYEDINVVRYSTSQMVRHYAAPGSSVEIEFRTAGNPDTTIFSGGVAGYYLPVENVP